MRGIKPSLAVAALAVVGLSVWAGARVDRSGELMASAANRFLASLDDGQKAKASFPFDGPERLNWHFIPRERNGLPIKAMTPEQRALAFGLLQTGLGAKGFVKATTIMSLDAVLREMEKGSGPVRDPERYFVSIFGTPSETDRWGWRVEGHHLSLNFVVENGKILSATPAFFGANPAEIRQGPRSGLRTLADFEDRALRFLQALDDDQKKVAVPSETAPADIRSAALTNGPALATQAPAEAPEGIAASALKDDQKAMLRALIETYSGDMPAEVAAAWLDEIDKAGFDKIRFAWYGAPDRSRGHAYKIQGPTFLIEFNNTQNNANHIHGLWRNELGDFGLPAATR